MWRPRKKRLPLFDLQNMRPVVFSHLRISDCMTDSLTDPSFSSPVRGLPSPDFLKAVLTFLVLRFVLNLNRNLVGSVCVDEANQPVNTGKVSQGVLQSVMNPR